MIMLPPKEFKSPSYVALHFLVWRIRTQIQKIEEDNAVDAVGFDDDDDWFVMMAVLVVLVMLMMLRNN